MEEYEKIFDFGKRDGYEAIESLTRTRSREYRRRPQMKGFELWNRPAPDLRMQLFHPRPIPRNSRQAVQPWKYRASFDSDEIQRNKQSSAEAAMIPSAMKDAIFGAPEKEKAIVVSPRVLRPWEAKLLFVKDGMLPKGRYVNPAPHDHRGYPPIKSLGLPEFEMSYEKDPYNLKFKTKTLDQIYGGQVPFRDELPGKQLGDTVLKQPPKWEKELHLPHGSYPTRSKQTTRHRPLYRSPHSAFMERVEHKLTAQWKRERTNIKTALQPV